MLFYLCRSDIFIHFLKASPYVFFFCTNWQSGNPKGVSPTLDRPLWVKGLPQAEEFKYHIFRKDWIHSIEMLLSYSSLENIKREFSKAINKEVKWSWTYTSWSLVLKVPQNWSFPSADCLEPPSLTHYWREDSPWHLDSIKQSYKSQPRSTISWEMCVGWPSSLCCHVCLNFRQLRVNQQL